MKRLPLLALYLATALVTSAASARAQGPDSQLPSLRPDFHLAVVPNLGSGDVSILDTLSNQEIARIAVGGKPQYAAMSSDGNYAYVGRRGAGPEPIVIVQIDLRTLSVSRTLALDDQAHLVELEISPDGNILAACDIYHGTLFVIDAPNLTLSRVLELCPTCGTEGNPVYAAVGVDFSSDSEFLCTVMPVEQRFQIIDPTSGDTLRSLRAPNSFGNVPYHDVKRTKDNRHFYLSHPNHSSVRTFDVLANTFSDLPFIGQDICDIELIPGTPLLVASSLTYGADQDNLHVLDVTSGAMIDMPSSESARYLTYNKLTNELWTTCATGFGACGPFMIDVFDMESFTRTETVSGPSNLAPGALPAFSQDGSNYYQSLSLVDEVLVIDARTHNITGTIPVGDNPRGVYMQGDATPKEVL